MRALIVDDSSFTRKYLREHLVRLGVTCVEAQDGREGLELLRHEGKFDLTLSDVNMPRMDGLTFVKSLREEGLGPAMKVMMITTETDESFISRALLYGADEFLMKPFTSQSLKEKLLLMGFAGTA